MAHEQSIVERLRLLREPILLILAFEERRVVGRVAATQRAQALARRRPVRGAPLERGADPRPLRLDRVHGPRLL